MTETKATHTLSYVTRPTPGPWTWSWGANVFAGERLVANCGGYADNRVADNGVTENEANAQLITAAPDLLAACEGLVGWIETANSVEGSVSDLALLGLVVELAAAAIAKAKGEVVK